MWKWLVFYTRHMMQTATMKPLVLEALLTCGATSSMNSCACVQAWCVQNGFDTAYVQHQNVLSSSKVCFKKWLPRNQRTHFWKDRDGHKHTIQDQVLSSIETLRPLAWKPPLQQLSLGPVHSQETLGKSRHHHIGTIQPGHPHHICQQQSCCNHDSS